MSQSVDTLSLTLFFICRPDQHILLGRKKRGWGTGRWNGFGGKQEAGETIRQAAVRELYEEAGIMPHQEKMLGRLTFWLPEQPRLNVTVFRADRFSGTVTETEEMKPRWFAHAAIPYGEMWPDDRYWLPLLLAGRSFSGTFRLSDEDTIVEHAVHSDVAVPQFSV